MSEELFYVELTVQEIIHFIQYIYKLRILRYMLSIKAMLVYWQIHVSHPLSCQRKTAEISLSLEGSGRDELL